MARHEFFTEVCAKGGLPQTMIDFLCVTYGTKKALYKDIDKGGPIYTEIWKEAGFTDKHCFEVRLSAIRLREERWREKQNRCIIF